MVTEQYRVIDSDINKILEIKQDIYDSIVNKGVDIQNNTPFENYPDKIDSIIVGENQVGIPRKVTAQGLYSWPSNFTFSLPSGVTTVDSYGLYYAFYHCKGIAHADLSNIINLNTPYSLRFCFSESTLSSFDLSNLQSISGEWCLHSAFSYCSNLTTVSFPKLSSITGTAALAYAFSYCSNLTTVSFPLLTEVRQASLSTAFGSCSSLTSVDFSNLTTCNYSSGLYFCFNECTSLTTIAFPKLSSIAGSSVLQQAFRNCTALKTISFPALTTSSFGSYTNQFNNMLQGVTGCTVHFPASIKTTIQDWSDVTSGFGGTNTTVLFDL